MRDGDDGAQLFVEQCLLRERELETQYAAAMQEWQGEAGAWEAVTADGLLGEGQ